MARGVPTCKAVIGEWLSLVEHLVRDQGVGGSNPLSPTISFQSLRNSEATAKRRAVDDFVAVRTSKSLCPIREVKEYNCC
jgi:hypothetical protein